MAIRSFFKRNWIHFAAVGAFLLVCSIYFSKQLQGYGLKQHDIEQHIGSSHEIVHYRETHDGEEPLWSNSMFGGMPTMQVSTIYHGNWFSTITTSFLKAFPPPMGIVLLYMFGFYIAMVLMGVNKWISILGSIAFAFLSYDIVLLQAGHNSKGIAVAFMLPVVGAFYYAYRRSWMLGAALSALFMAFEMAANHLQITYYLGFVLLALGIVEVVKTIRPKNLLLWAFGRVKIEVTLESKNWLSFLKTTTAIVAAYLLAFAVNYGSIKLTADYAKYTIRGGNEVTIKPDGTSNAQNATSGLDRDYVTQYSYGIGESFTLISPYVKGGGTMAVADSPFADIATNSALTSDQINMVMSSNAYWGNQPIVSGPVYLSVILVLLALLGMVYIKDKMKWAFLSATILTLMLAWGKNYMGLTDWFLDNVPGYNKFRAVTIIMVIVEMCTAVLAMLFLNELIKNKEEIKGKLKPMYITLGAFLLVLIVMKAGGIEKSYLSDQENNPNARMEQEQAVRDQIAGMDPAQLAQNGINKNDPAQLQQIVDNQLKQFDDRNLALTTVRKEIFSSSMNRSIGFTIAAIICLLLVFHSSLPVMMPIGALGGLIIIDLILVSSNYLNNEPQGSGYKYWEERLNTRYPISPEQGDLSILENEIQSNPTLKGLVEKGRAEGRQKALDLGAVGVAQRRIEDAYAFAALNANTNYRVFDYSGGFNSARTSYMHKSLGGYHGAKLRSIQNLFEFHLATSNNKVFDMMNVKYFLQPASQEQGAGLMARPNPTAMGNAWLVNKLKVVSDANAEIQSLGNQFKLENAGAGKLLVNGVEKPSAVVSGGEKLAYLLPGLDTLSIGISNGVPVGLDVFIVSDVNGTVNTVPAQTIEMDTSKSFTKLVKYAVKEQFDLKKEAVVRADMSGKIGKTTYAGKGSILMTDYAPNKLKYTVNASDDAFAVFSEIYYPEGWIATVDGKETDIYRVNYLLRGIKIPKGKHAVEFKFELKSFATMNWISLLGSIIIGSLVIFLCVRSKKEELQVS